MNPHFIFNSLNSIENFMLRNEKLLASDYLNKFARLIRMILDSTRTHLVSFAKDMEAIQLYVDLEQLRFQQKFCFRLSVDPQLVNGDFSVPPMLIQPYVENAIVHGLAPCEKEKLHLSISAELKNNVIIYTIQDNGIGRKQSEFYRQQNKPEHKSMGMQIARERINIFNREQQFKGTINIIDMTDQELQPEGTRVEITIKAL